MKMYRCPVCGYDQIKSPPIDFTICPSCGTEFEYHDAVRSHAELRQQWISKGAKWHSLYIAPPPNWNWYQQLLKANLIQPLTTQHTETTVQKRILGQPFVRELQIFGKTVFRLETTSKTQYVPVMVLEV